MPKVVPSQIVEYIDSRFQGVRAQLAKKENTFQCDSSWHATINTIIDLIDNLPNNLITLTGDDYFRFVEAANELKGAVALWSSDHAAKMKHTIYKMRDHSKMNPITFIRIALSECPDQGFEKSKTGLSFIKDNEFRETLNQDISYVNEALFNAEWKASTILAGSVVEALLLDAVTKLKSYNKEKFDKKRDELLKDDLLGEPMQKKPPNNPIKWNLNQYIRFCFSSGIITESTAKGCLIAKDYRNLIHPGESIRKNMICDRGTALKAVGALEHVINDLS